MVSQQMSGLPALQKKLLSEVGSLLHRYGFDKKPVDQSLRLAKSFGWASIHLTFVRHPPIDFDVVVNAAIRVDVVQDCIQNGDSLISIKDRKQSATIGCELGNLKGVGQQRWTISSEKDVGPVACAIAAECEATLLPFIEKYSDLDELLEVLAADTKVARLISPIDSKRNKTIDALSKLLKSP